MKKVILKRLQTNNWRAQSVDFTFNGNANIYGQNKSGKTKIFSVFMWILTGFDDKDRSNFQLFDNKLEMTHENAIPAEGHIWLDIDGNEYKFSRTAVQSWSRARGQAEYTKNSADKYKVFIDDIELSAGEFKKRIEDMFCPIETLKVILNVRHIFNLDWKTQRELFASICDEIKKEDFKGDYSALFNELKKYSLNELEARVKTNITPLKDTLRSLPLTIETLKMNLPDISDLDDVQKRIDRYNKQINDIDEGLQNANQKMIPILEKRNKELDEISELKRQLADRKAAYIKEKEEEPNSIKLEIQRIKDINKEIDYDNSQNEEKRIRLEEKKKRFEEEVKNYISIRERLLKEKEAILSKEFLEEKCAYCGQDLPYEKLEELKNNFYEKREQEKQEIIRKGKKNNEYRDAAIESIKEIEAEIAQIPQPKPLNSYEELEEKLREKKYQIIPFEETKEYKELLSEIAEKERMVTPMPEQDNSGLLNMKQDLMEQIQEESRKIGLIDERKKQEQKIEEYKNQQIKSANELAQWEKMDVQIKAYKQEQATIVSEKVNALLNRCKVEMMQQTKGGEWVPSCVISTDNVQSSVYNRAERVISGMDISNAFMNKYELNMPLFIDDAETITSNSVIETNRQLIKLIASDKDNKLRIEYV